VSKQGKKCSAHLWHTLGERSWSTIGNGKLTENICSNTVAGDIVYIVLEGVGGDIEVKEYKRKSIYDYGTWKSIYDDTKKVYNKRML